MRDGEVPVVGRPLQSPSKSPSRATAVSWLTLLLALGLALAAAGSRYTQVFLKADQIVAFVDADCYARMTRVREEIDHPGARLARHEFENYPFGTQPHTTLPFDAAILALRAGLRLAGSSGSGALDLAGALISPLLGVGMLAGLWWWGQRERLCGWWASLLVLAASPILAHGFALGRPDHQSLILLCLAAALAAEWSFWRRPAIGRAMLGGAAWGVGLWTSLYEPVVVLGVVLLAGAVFNRSAFWRRERLAGVAVAALILLTAVFFEGWPVLAVPGYGEGNGAPYFAAWSRQIGELQGMPPWSPTLFRWSGLALAAAPVLLLWPRGEERRIARAQAVLLAAVFALTCWQTRWGYFLPLIYALSLPWQVAAIAPRLRPLAAAVFLLGLWPMAAEWQRRLQPSPETAAALAEQRQDTASLRQAARFISEASAGGGANPDTAGILAPWWLSPPLAYWSGQPAVAGSSHESLPGIVDTALFFTAGDPAAAVHLLRRRQVRWVVAYDADRVLSTAASLLGSSRVSSHAPGAVLYREPAAAPGYLRLALVNPDFKVYEVLPAALPP